MSNRILSKSADSPSPLAMRANASVFGAEDQLRENRVASYSEQSIYPTYPTTFIAYVPTAEHNLDHNGVDELARRGEPAGEVL